MSQKCNRILVGFAAAGFIAVSAALFLSTSYLIPIFSAFLFLVFSIQWLGYGAAAFISVAFSSLVGVYCMSRVSHEEAFAIPSLLLTLYVTSFLIYWHGERLAQRRRRHESTADEANRDVQALGGETNFYEQRLRELAAMGEKRRKLSRAASELGALLDPTKIQQKLIEVAQAIFPSRIVRLSYGQENDPVDNAVIQRRASVLIPDPAKKNFSAQGAPLMAVPVFAQKNVAGILRVGADAGPAFGRDEFRLLEILASLASLSLDNSILFGQVQDTALRDGLTGLLTHRAFQEHLETQLLEASRYKSPLSVVIADVDHFKKINDTYGHQVGDQVLQGVAHVLARNVRDVDVVARYGGEEFALILLQTDEAAARELAEAIRVDLAGQVFDVGQKIISVTASFGVSTFPADATSGPQLMRRADERLYQAKQDGRNRVRGKW